MSIPITYKTKEHKIKVRQLRASRPSWTGQAWAQFIAY